MSNNMYPDLQKQPLPQGQQQPPPHPYQPPPQGYPGQPPPAYAPGYGQHPGAQAAQPYPGQPQTYQGVPPQGQPPQYAGAPPQGQGLHPYQTAGVAAAPGQTVIIHHAGPTAQPYPVQPARSNLSNSLGSLFSGASKVAKSVGNTVQKEMDIHASSPTLSVFRNGAILQFLSRSNNQAMRTLSNGALDCLGNPAYNDAYTHYKIQNHGNNVVTLNCMGNPTFFVTIDKMGNTLGNGPGGYESKFRLHETLKGFITFESLSNPSSHIAIMANGQMKPAKGARKDQDSQFSIRVIVPAQQMMQHPGQQTIIVQHK